MNVLPWIEKYRPNYINDVISHNNITTSIKNFIENENMPHILFYGPPGVGKTSLILATTREMYGKYVDTMVLELNASDERGIDVVRSRIKKFVITKNLFDPQCSNTFKTVILDEIDALTDDAQCILRRIIEDNTRNARFCLICNYINKINIALRSRCICFKFGPIKKKFVIEKIKQIIETENIKMSDGAIKTLIDRSNGDMRKVLNILQSTLSLTNSISSDDINNCIGFPLNNQIGYIFKILLFSKMNENSVDILTNFINENAIYVDDILFEIHDYFINNIDTYNVKTVMNIFIKLKYININVAHNTNNKINIASIVLMLCDINKEINDT